jgi:uncharacterized membrane protein
LNKVFKKTLRHFSNRILAGVALTVPLYLTVLVFKTLFHFTDGFLSAVAAKIIGWHIPGMGLILLVLILYFAGLITMNLGAKKLLSKIEKLVDKIPLGGIFFRTTKQLVEVISDPESKAFQKVVLVNYLGHDRNTLGFVTGSSLDRDGKKLIHVYVPTPPNPVTGFLHFAYEDQLIETNMTFEEGARFALSVGASSPIRLS